jgi:PAS domain-containing protein
LTEIPKAARLLDNLERGVLVLSLDLRVLYANARWTSWLGSHMQRDTSFLSHLAEHEELTEAELRATSEDGRARSFVAPGYAASGGVQRPSCR